jgi:hypothetical protein
VQSCIHTSTGEGNREVEAVSISRPEKHLIRGSNVLLPRFGGVFVCVSNPGVRERIEQLSYPHLRRRP